MFIHTDDIQVFKELKEMGFVPLKENSPFVLLFDNSISFNFDNKNLKINDTMYF